MDKPLSLIINETKQNFIKTINNAGLPLALLEMIMKDVYFDLKNASDIQAKKELEEYNIYLVKEKEEKLKENEIDVETVS